MPEIGRKPMELLAPAGDEASLRAAVCAGANAVYLGFSRFGARASAANFDAEALEKRLPMRTCTMTFVKIICAETPGCICL